MMHWRGFHIVLAPDAQPVPNVLAVLPEQARAAAERAVGVLWQALDQAGYRVLPVDVWERR